MEMLFGLLQGNVCPGGFCGYCPSCLLRSLLKYWSMSRCVDFWAVQGATREHTPRGSVTEEQRSTAQKAAQPSGRGQIGPSGGVARSLQPHAGMRVARALPYGPI